MRKPIFILSLLMIFSMVVLGSGEAVGKEPVFGKTYEEIVKLAKEEGIVEFASGMSSDDRLTARIMKPFVEKYGIKYKHTLIIGTESRERILFELIAGRCDYDFINTTPVLIPKYLKTNQYAGPFDWQGLFGKEFKINPRFISPDKRMITVGGTAFGFTYNPKLVPKERIPRSWNDFLDPWWKGKFVIVTRPLAFAAMYPHRGKEETLKYMRDLAAQKPIWLNSFNSALAGVISGEFPAIVGMNRSDVLNQLDRSPEAKSSAVMVLPDEVYTVAYFHSGVFKQAKHPNAALLALAWFVSENGGQKQFDKEIHRGDPLTPGTEIVATLKKLGAKSYPNGWELTPEMEAQISKEIVQAWGMPKGR